MNKVSVPTEKPIQKKVKLDDLAKYLREHPSARVVGLDFDGSSRDSAKASEVETERVQI